MREHHVNQHVNQRATDAKHLRRIVKRKQNMKRAKENKQRKMTLKRTVIKGYLGRAISLFVNQYSRLGKNTKKGVRSNKALKTDLSFC
jgi:hypothetical protein